jgi:hypothetical protein
MLAACDHHSPSSPPVPSASSAPIPGGPGTPAISFTNVPPRGTYPATVTGKVQHVLPRDHRVAVYIHTWNGWWTKPYWDSPLTTISDLGEFACSITTGGIDDAADMVVAYLVLASYAPPLASGDSAIPGTIDSTALAEVTARR